MISSVALSLLILVASISSQSDAQTTVSDPNIVGTWSSKSGTVMTGPDFYDPASEMMKEPRLPGSSFSFTADGYFEEALYLVISNPTQPSCPVALLQWQHGKYDLYNNGSLVLIPIKVDGRQLMSDPCRNSRSIYTRFNQTETYKWYEVLTDERRGKKRLNLYKFDGAPMNPMYLEYQPPQMLPTQTLNPLPTTTGTAGTKATGGSQNNKLKRSLKKADDIDPDRLWWIGVGLTSLGFIGYFCV